MRDGRHFPQEKLNLEFKFEIEISSYVPLVAGFPGRCVHVFFELGQRRAPTSAANRYRLASDKRKDDNTHRALQEGVGHSAKPYCTRTIVNKGTMRLLYCTHNTDDEGNRDVQTFIIAPSTACDRASFLY